MGLQAQMEKIGSRTNHPYRERYTEAILSRSITIWAVGFTYAILLSVVLIYLSIAPLQEWRRKYNLVD